MNCDSARHATQRVNPTEIQGYVGLVIRCIPATHPMLGRLLAVHIYIISVVCSTGLLRVQPSDLTMMPLDLLPLPSSPPLGQDSQTPEAAKYHRLVPVLQQYIVVLISTVLSHKICTNPPHSLAYPTAALRKNIHTFLHQLGPFPPPDQQRCRKDDESVPDQVQKKAAQPVFLHALQHDSPPLLQPLHVLVHAPTNLQTTLPIAMHYKFSMLPVIP